MIRNIWQDLKHSVRVLGRNPGFTLVALLTLALGIGATSAIFSIVNAVLLRPFPYEEPDRLVIVWERSERLGLPYMFAAPPNYVDWRAQNQVFEEMGAFRERRYFLEQAGELQLVNGARLTASVFPVIGSKPMLGRVFTAEDDRPGAEPVVLLSQRIWRSRFGGDPDLVGQTIRLNESSYRVIGVMPPEFDFPPPIIEQGIAPVQDVDLWVPFALDMGNISRGAHNLNVLARLRDGVDLRRAEAEMNTIAGRLQEGYPDTNAGWEITLVPLLDQVVGNARAQLLVLLGAVGFVLLIACVNVANLLLARGTTRLREFALRASLGAGRARLIRQLLTESLVLSLAGGAIGLACAVAGVRLLVRIAPQNIARLDQAGLDLQMVLFTLLVSVLTGALFGVAPAFQSATRNLAARLREGGRGQAAGGRGARLRSGLVVSEVALSLVLLVGAGLLFQSFVRLRGVEKGFQAEDRLTMRVSLPRSRYQEPANLVAGFTELERRLSATAGIRSAGFITELPLAEDRGGTSFIKEGESEPPQDENRSINVTVVTPDYFQAMGIRLLRGRQFSEQDAGESEPVIIVNDAFVRRHFPGEDPIGRRVGIHESWRRIVGVVADVRHATLRDDPNPSVYAPFNQEPHWSSMSLVVFGDMGTDATLASAREVIRQFDAALPVYNVKTMDEILGDSLARMRFSSFLMAVFSVVALLLAAVGIYGVIAYSVSRRTQEIGVRVAIGAETGDIIGLVLKHGMRLAGLGILVGIVAAIGLSRLVASILYGVGALDLSTFGGVAVVLALVAVLACYLPARRATKVDPMVALRYE